MDKISTKNYYESLGLGDVCDCEYCKNYVKRIKLSYPLVSNYLWSIGVDIEKPFDTTPVSSVEDENICYAWTQYIVFGNKDSFKSVEISGVHIDLSESYPPIDVLGDCFVIEVDLVCLKGKNCQNI